LASFFVLEIYREMGIERLFYRDFICKYESMMITKEDFDKLETKINDYYHKHRHIHTPALGLVKVTPNTLIHLRGEDKKHPRTMQEVYMRYLCFLSIDKILV